MHFLQTNSSCQVNGIQNSSILEILDHALNSQRRHTGVMEARQRYNIHWVLEEPTHAIVTSFGAEDVAGERLCRRNFPGAVDIDLLALHFALVKILFLTGRMKFIPPLIQVIEPGRVGQELHKTTIRNEQAYYTSISQILSTPFPAVEPSDVIHVFGDSHVLSLAWRSLKVGPETMVLQPVLATGVKAWHLREEGDFYPKANFFNAARSIPIGSKVLFVFGEIDCRYVHK